jgi:hypothetical protein
MATRKASKKAAKKVPVKEGKSRDYEVGYKKPPPHTRFKPGESGNPAGRPKSITFSEAMRTLLAEIADPAEQKTQAEELAQVALAFAIQGSHQHLKEINDRVEGKARQPIDLKVESPREALAKMLGISPDDLPEPKQDA